MALGGGGEGGGEEEATAGEVDADLTSWENEAEDRRGEVRARVRRRFIAMIDFAPLAP